MNTPRYIYTFAGTVPMKEVEDYLLLATLAAECLHGRSQVHLDASFMLDPKTRSCEVNATTSVGKTIASIFTGFLVREFGVKVFSVKRLDTMRSL